MDHLRLYPQLALWATDIVARWRGLKNAEPRLARHAPYPQLALWAIDIVARWRGLKMLGRVWTTCVLHTAGAMGYCYVARWRGLVIIS